MEEEKGTGTTAANPTTDFKKRNVAFKLKIGDILKGTSKMEESKFLFLELGEKKVVRVNVLANCVDKFIQDGEKKYASLTIDDASGQIKIKAFGDDIELLKKINQGDTLQIVGNLREWNAELYILPEIIKSVDPRWLLVRKLEIQKLKEDIPDPKNATLRDKIMQIIRSSEEQGGVDTEKIIMDVEAKEALVKEVLKKLLEEGLIYEPRPGRIRWLG